MSVIVKGMDMPKNCAYCPLSEYRNTSLGQILDCKRIGTVGSAVRGTHDVLNHRHPNCPLVDSPESHWIPVTEATPTEDDDYWCTFGAETGWFVDWCSWYQGRWVVWTDNTVSEVRNVIAWCKPLEPYKGVTK